MNYITRIVMILIIITSILVGCGKDNILHNDKDTFTDDKNKSIVDSKINLGLLKTFLISATNVKDEIEYEISEAIIGKYNEIDLYAITGEYSEFNKVKNLLEKYFSEEMIETEISELGLFKVKNKVGKIAADGEEVFYIVDNSNISVEKIENGNLYVKVQMFSDFGNEKITMFTLRVLNDNNWIIIDKEGKKNVEELITEELRWEKIESSSNMENYPPYNMVDNKHDTAWATNYKIDIYDWIRLYNDVEQEINGILILNGFSKSKELYYANNRIIKIKIELSNGESFVKELHDDAIDSYQKIDFGYAIRTYFVKVTILDVIKGNKYNDICISEIKVY